MDSITSIDFSILNFIQEHLRCDFLDVLMPFISTIGNAGIIWIVCAVVMLFFKKTRAAGAIALVAMGVGYLLGDVVIKHIVMRPRPFTVDSDLNLFRNTELLIKKPGSTSFPSGHSAAAAAFMVTLLVKNRVPGLISVLPVLLMMFSRLYNYVHYPTDVLCGAILGALTALLMLFIAHKTKIDNKLSPQNS